MIFAKLQEKKKMVRLAKIYMIGSINTKRLDRSILLLFVSFIYTNTSQHDRFCNFIQNGKQNKNTYLPPLQ